MAHFQLETKTTGVSFLPLQEHDVIRVSYFEKKYRFASGQDKILETIYMSLTDKHIDKLQSYKSVSALVKYAKANQIQLQAETPCPVPASTPAKSSEQGQGILIGDDTPTPCPVTITNAPYSGNDGDGASLFCDIETTGRGRDAEVVEIAIVDADENVLFETFF